MKKMTMKKIIPIIKPVVALSALCLQAPLLAAGFAIVENSASGVGNSFAGAAAVGEDASTVWFNPAAMSRLGDRPAISSSAHLIMPSAKFTDRGSSVNPNLTGGNSSLASALLTGQPSDTADTNAFVPNIYYVRSINDRMHFGVGVNAPFGLEVTYEDNWIGRYLATRSEMETININPSISWKANDRLSLGAGLNAQYINVKLGSAIDSGALCRSSATALNDNALLVDCLTNPQLGLANAASDSKALISGDDVSYGYNLGLLLDATPRTRIGASYRSKISHKLKGTVDFTVNSALSGATLSNGMPLNLALGASTLKDREVTANADLPDSASFSIAHQLNNRFELLADATWTGWSSFKELRVVDTAGSDIALTNEDWEDVWRYSIGGKYHYSDQLTLRAGAALDKSPIPNANLRTPRIPGNDRHWLSFGADYKIRDNIKVNVGYAHLFVDDTAINHTSADNGYTIKGLYESDVDILSAQLNWKY